MRALYDYAKAHGYARYRGVDEDVVVVAERQVAVIESDRISNIAVFRLRSLSIAIRVETPKWPTPHHVKWRLTMFHITSIVLERALKMLSARPSASADFRFLLPVPDAFVVW